MKLLKPVNEVPPARRTPLSTKTITVTQNDINLGTPSESDSCPIALAITSSGFYHVFVEDEKIEWFSKYNRRSMIPPKKVRQFIERFDAGKPVRPFSFQLRWKI